MRDALQSFFFFGFTEVVCAYIRYRSVSGCVYSTIVCRILFMPTALLDVCVLLLFAVHTYRLSLCYFLGLGHILLTRVGDSFKLQNVNDVLLLIDCEPVRFYQCEFWSKSSFLKTANDESTM